MADTEKRGGQETKANTTWKSRTGPALAIVLFLILVAILVVVMLTKGGRSDPNAIYPDETVPSTTTTTSTTSSSSSSSTSQTPNRRPHIILIVADDMGYNDISWNNPTEVDTPVLETLAREGVILDQNYMTPMCSPSRGSMMTGKYPFRIQMQHDRLTDGEWCIPHNEKILAEYLQDEGYSTNIVGKWHQGYCSWNCTPLYRGFDSFYGFYGPFVGQYYHHHYTGGYDWRDGDQVDYSANGTYATHLITRRSLEIIHNHNPDEPLFLYVSQLVPHNPVEVPPGFTPHDRSPEGRRADYVVMLKALDNSTGEILQALRETGIYDNSIIIFTSDNGGQQDSGSNYPLRGSKWSAFEGGTRAVAMVHSPLLTARGTVTEGLIHATDWFTTILSLAGSKADLGFRDGLDQTNHLLHGAISPRSEIVYSLDDIEPYTLGQATIRDGDYKLILGFPGIADGWEQYGNLGATHGVAIITNGTRLVNLTENIAFHRLNWDDVAAYARLVQDSVMLFNVKEDPTEERNLAESEPEIVERLRMRLVELQAEIVPQDPKAYTYAPQGAAQNFGGVLQPGWCNFEEV